MNTIHLQHRFDAPVELLFRAWSEPALLAKWAWGSLGRSVQAQVDFRIGGSFQIETVRPEDERWSFSGLYTEIRTNSLIAHTLEWNAPMGYPSAPETVEVRFSADGAGSAVDFVHKGVPDEKSADGHRAGWQNTFDTLASLLQTPEATMRSS